MDYTLIYSVFSSMFLIHSIGTDKDSFSNKKPVFYHFLVVQIPLHGTATLIKKLLLFLLVD